MPRQPNLQRLVDLGLVSEEVAQEIDRREAGGLLPGRPLTLDELYQLAIITEAEIAQAAGDWQATAPSNASDWLEVAGAAALLTYLLRDRGTGRPLDVVEQRIELYQSSIGSLTEGLSDGQLTVAEWQQVVAEDLRNMHLQNAAIGRGGWANLTDPDLRKIEDGLRFQYEHLDGFANDIVNGKLSPEQIKARAQLYAQSGRAAYWDANTTTQSDTGYTEERRIAIGDKGTCTPCNDLEALGWQPIGSLPNPGGEPCDGLTNCRCTKEYR